MLVFFLLISGGLLKRYILIINLFVLGQLLELYSKCQQTYLPILVILN